MELSFGAISYYHSKFDLVKANPCKTWRWYIFGKTLHNICTNRWLKFRIPGSQRPSLSTCEPILPNPPYRTLIFHQIIDFQHIIPSASFFLPHQLQRGQISFKSTPFLPPQISLKCHAVESLKFNRLAFNCLYFFAFLYWQIVPIC